MNKKIGFIITSYANEQEKKDILYNLIKQIRKLENIFLIVSSHAEIEYRVQELVDYVIFDRNNPVDFRKYSHGCAESILIESSLKILQYYKIEKTFKIPFDCKINDSSIFENWKKEDKFKVVSSKWGDNYFSSFAFYADINWFLETFSFYQNIDEMFKRSNVLEEIWYEDLIIQNKLKDVFLFEDFRKDMFKIYETSNEVDLFWKDYNKIEHNKIEHFYQNIDGMFDFQDIYSEMVNIAENNFWHVEVGAWRGKSSAYLATEINNSGKNIKFDVIDTWEGSKGDKDEQWHNNVIQSLDVSLYEDFLRNINPVKHIINPIVGRSTDIANNYKDNSLDFVFIDAAHDFDNIKADIEAWFRKVKIGGYIGGHDYNGYWTGVKRAVNWYFDNDIEVRLNSWLHKKQDNLLIENKQKLNNKPTDFIIEYSKDNNRINITNYGETDTFNLYFKTLDNFELCNKIENFKFEKDVNFWFSLLCKEAFWHKGTLDLYVDVYDKEHNFLFNKELINNQETKNLIKKYGNKKQRYFVSFTDEKLLGVSEYLVKTLNEFSDYKIIMYGINCNIDYDYPNLIKERINFDVSTIPHVVFLKPFVVLNSIKYVEEGIFIDADIMVNKNIDDLWNNFKYMDRFPLFNKAAWEYCVFNKRINPHEVLLDKYKATHDYKLPYVQTNLFLFNNKYPLNIIADWEKMCLDKDNHNILKTDPYIVDESLLNVLLRKEQCYQSLNIITSNVYCLNDLKFVLEEYNYKKYLENSNNFKGKIDLDNGYYPEKPETSEVYIKIPQNINETKAFHGCKDTKEQEKIFNYLISENKTLKIKSIPNQLISCSYKNDKVYNIDIKETNNIIKNENHIYINDEFSKFLNDLYNNTYNKPKNLISKNTTIMSFLDGAKVEIWGNKRKDYKVSFKDKNTNETLYNLTESQNRWFAPNRKYYADWEITINDKIYNFDLKNKDVYISIDSTALGDTIAWFPYCEEFRKKHNCNLFVSTFHNSLFEENYKNIKFVNPGANDSLFFARYKVGAYEDNLDRNKINWRDIPLQQCSSDYLGLEFKEIRSNIVRPDNIKRKIKDKYVCIGVSSTMQAKLWNYENGWQEIIDYLNKLGYKIVDLSKGTSNFNGDVVNCTGKSLNEIIEYLEYCEFYIGLGSGLSWLAWAMNKKVILISGFSKPFTEFSTNYRVFLKDVCNGCFNDKSLRFGKNWSWCPRNKDFECTKKITPNIIKKYIDQLLIDNLNL